LPIAKITGQGLAVIAAAVALLWACVIGERVVSLRASAQQVRVLRDLQRMQYLQRHSQPAAAPVPVKRLPRSVTAA
jgi:hypothetical protein